MAFGKIKKCILGLALGAVVAFSAAASACVIETGHPKAQITFEFNEVTYEVNYTLYRNMYPQTVRHFIELADSGFYNDTIIHNYDSNDWFTGGYSFDKTAYSQFFEDSAMDQYFDDYSKEDVYYKLAEDGALTPSVYSDAEFKRDKKGNIIYEDADGKTVNEGDKGATPALKVSADNALPTLVGEFERNLPNRVKNGALTAEVGCLKMFYYEKETTNKAYVTPNSSQIIRADYKYNCATSIFGIQSGANSSYTENSYCVFAKTKSTKDYDKLDELIRAVEEYVSSNSTISATAYVDRNEAFSKEAGDKGISVTFKSTKLPIVIKSVKIKKY